VIFVHIREKAVLEHDFNEFLDGMHVQFLKDVTAVLSHGVVTDVKRLGGLPVGLSITEAHRYLDLVLAEQLRQFQGVIHRG